MWKEQKRRQLNNKGMSLVEVIIAITILSVVAVSVLHAISTAMVYNAKARRRQSATLNAESMMEAFNGYNLETLCAAFHDSDALRNMMGYEQAGAIDGPDEVDVKNLEPKYTFTIDDMKVDADTDVAYDVTIDVIPVDENMVVLETTNPLATSDAILLAQQSWDEDIYARVLQNFKDEYRDEFEAYVNDGLKDADGNYKKTNKQVGGVTTQVNVIPLSTTDPSGHTVLSVSDVTENNVILKERRIEITAKGDGTGTDTVEISMVYFYRIEGVPYYTPVYPENVEDEYYGDEEEETQPENTNEEVFIGEQGEMAYPYQESEAFYLKMKVDIGESQTQEGGYVFYENPRDAGLERIMFYYYPQYEVNKDTIIFKNDTVKKPDNIPLPLDVFLLKQRIPNYSDTKTYVAEQGYYCDVTGASGMTLYHNLDENIGSEEPVSLGNATITGFGKEMNFIQGEDMQKKIVPIYQVELTVKDTITGKEVTKLTSTMYEK